MILHSIYYNVLFPCTHYLKAYQDIAKTRELYKEINIYFRIETKQKMKEAKLNNPLYFWMGDNRCSEQIIMKIQKLMVTLALKNGWVFVHFVVFTSTLVYSVVYNQSVLNGNIYNITYKKSTTSSYYILCDYTY